MTIDARTFGEICKTLTRKEWLDLLPKLQMETHKSPQTIYHWKNGDYSPDECVREKIVDVLKKRLNLQTTTSTLFPTR